MSKTNNITVLKACFDEYDILKTTEKETDTNYIESYLVSIHHYEKELRLITFKRSKASAGQFSIKCVVLCTDED